uniref:Aminotransferase-like plant mobile domain-containing protein n=1 Tax=Triticum urartu TaxID=4572 RepID=A0A8R7V8Y6_TRIUA
MLPPLRMKGNTKVTEMKYNNCYEPYYRRVGLLGFVLRFKSVPPTLVHTALTSLVDHWRPEMHSFHLPCGEMTVTLEDFAMIMALPIHGQALIGRVERKNWPDRVNALIGGCPPMKNNRTSGVPLPWLLTHRVVCPQDADPRTVEQYARAYLLFLLTEVVFPDCSGDNALWM